MANIELGEILTCAVSSQNQKRTTHTMSWVQLRPMAHSEHSATQNLLRHGGIENKDRMVSSLATADHLLVAPPSRQDKTTYN